MKSIFTLYSFSAFILVFFFQSVLAQVTYVDYGSSTNYSLNNGDSLYIASGTYTGTISMFRSSARIGVAENAQFEPASMPNNSGGTITNYGTFRIASLTTNNNFTLHNYGVVWVTGTTTLNGSSQNWNNYYSGIMNLVGNVSMTSNNGFTNRGTVNCGANISLTNTAVLLNKNTFTINGNLTANGGIINNEGKMESVGSLTFNMGSTINNSCRMIAQGGIYNTSSALYNNGLLWAKAAAGTGNIQNTGTIINGTTARIKSVNFTNTGTVIGAGYLYFTGSTTTTGLGVTGIATSTADTIRIYDITRLNALTIYDVQTGTVNPNVAYASFPAPDTIYNFIGCAIEIISNIPLPVKWSYFQVTLLGNVPTLSWSSEQEKGTVYEIQRSYDGNLFTVINNLAADDAISMYRYEDEKVNSQKEMVYYRILAIEPNGMKKYSETRTVKFNSKKGISITAIPNPFTSDLVLQYESTESKTLTLSVYNLAGQLKLTRHFTLTEGSNRIPVSGLSGLTKGLYIIHLTDAAKLLAVEKVIKQ